MAKAATEGETLIKKGFGFTAADDLAFANGWPHVKELTDDDVDPHRLAVQLLQESDFDLRIRWPRRLAVALVHAWGAGQLFDLAPGTRAFRQATEEAVWNAATPDRDVVNRYIAERMLRTPMWTDERATEAFVLLLEALTEPEWVADAIVTQLEGMDRGTLHQLATQPALITFQLGYLLLRVAPATAAALRRRMREVVEFGGGVHEDSEVKVQVHPNHVRSLLLVLDGAAAADRYTDKDCRWYTHAIDTPQAVLMRASINRRFSMPDARLVWIGGPEVIDTKLIARWPRLSARDQRWFFDGMARIEDERMVPLMASMAKSGHGTQASALAWLREHDALARPVLKRLSDASADARDVLEEL